MIKNKLLISFIISLLITGIYYYLYKDTHTEDENNKEIGIYVTIFISILIITYLIQIGYLSDKKVNKPISTEISGGEYKPPF